MKHLTLTALAFAVMASSASAATYVLDFDTTDPSNTTLDSTVTQSITNPRTFVDDAISWVVNTGGGRGAALFDSTCTGYTSNCNDDPDLSPADQNNSDGVSGNVLIQQRNQGTLTPNDDAATDIITLTLDSDVQLRWTAVSAIDNGAYRFGTSVDANELGRIDIAGEAETASVTFATASGILSKGDQIFLFFDRAGSTNPSSTDSGAIDNLRFTLLSPAPQPVPVPASLPLLLGGFAVLAGLRRRRRA